jgi:pyruvate,orthophosphate dikinase
VAVVTDLGGSTSHAAVVTRALGRPSVVGVGDGVAESMEGQVLTVDGGAGKVYAGRLPLIATSVDDHPSLRTLSVWATERCPTTVVHEAEGAVLDVDAVPGVVDADTGTIDTVALVAALRAAQGPVTGRVLNSPQGAVAILESGVATIVAARRLPIQLRLIQAQPDA